MLNVCGTIVPRVGPQSLPVDGLPVQPRRSPGLQPSQRQSQSGKRLRQANRGGLAHPAGRRLTVANMNDPPQKCPRRQYHRTTADSLAVRTDDCRDPAVSICLDILGTAGAERQVRRFFQQPSDCPPIQDAVRLSPRSSHRRPLLRLSNLKWIPAASAARPIKPSSASISRTRCPFPMPPIDGLHDISPTVSSEWVSSNVRAPIRPAAAAASHPACPPPTTTTS